MPLLKSPITLEKCVQANRAESSAAGFAGAAGFTGGAGSGFAGFTGAGCTTVALTGGAAGVVTVALVGTETGAVGVADEQPASATTATAAKMVSFMMFPFDSDESKVER